MQLFFDPTIGIEPPGLAPVGTIGPAYQIRGHYHDQAAKLCTQGVGSGTLDWYWVWLSCETAFVVEDLQPSSQVTRARPRSPVAPLVDHGLSATVNEVEGDVPCRGR